MAEQLVIWTGLPKEIEPVAQRVVLSVHVAPRLWGPTELKGFPDWLNWPAVVKGFKVSFGGATAVKATVVSDPAASEELWKGLFEESTPVEERRKVEPPLKSIISAPVARSHAYLRRRYSEFLASTNHPSRTELEKGAKRKGQTKEGAGLGELAYFGEAPSKFEGKTEEERKKEMLEWVHGRIERRKKMLEGLAADVGAKGFNEFKDRPLGAVDVLAVEAFFKRGEPPAGSQQAPKLLQPPKADFHTMLAAASAHPRLLRLLGLVIDLEVSGYVLASGQTSIQVVPEWSSALGANSTNVTPVTNCEVQDGLFFAQPEEATEYLAGQLQLGELQVGGPLYDIFEIDSDGAALKALNWASSLASQVEKETVDTSETSTLPSLRGAGLAVAREERGQQFHQLLKRGQEVNEAIEKGEHPTLHLENVTRGWYVDVWDSHAWHSLSQRTGNINFTKLGKQVPVPTTDEAPVTALPAGANGVAALYMHEFLFHWTGWSLAAPEPGNTILEDEKAGQPPATPSPPFPIKFEYTAAPGSLPRLRFGTEYAVRMRAADIAGNSIPFALGADVGEKVRVREKRFLRFDPINSPVVIPDAPAQPGDSTLRLVLRSNYDEEPQETASRYIAPARTSERMAELHGVFDAMTPKEAYDLIIARESQTIGGVQDPNAPEGVLYVNGALTEPPYLPDVLATGAALQKLPGTHAGEVFEVGFTSRHDVPEWPKYEVFKLLIKASTPALGPAGAPVIVPQAGIKVLEVQLPKADVTEVRLSSSLHPSALELLGLPQWAAEEHVGLSRRTRNEALKGMLWMLTPFKTLILVHAVRQPLKTPEFKSPFAEREVNAIFAAIRDEMSFSRKSTSKADMYASWSEPVDEGPGQATPYLREIGGGGEATFVFSVDIDRRTQTGELPEEVLVLDESHFFGDTKHRTVTYTAIATTKFAEYFQQEESLELKHEPETVTLSPEGFIADSVSAWLLVTNVLKPHILERKPLTHGEGEWEGAYSSATTYAEGAIVEEGGSNYIGLKASNKGNKPSSLGEWWALLDADFTVNEEKGEVNFAKGGAATIGSKVLVSFLAPPITRETERPKALSIPSSARPPAPKVLYLVPTFTWTEPEAASSERKGGGLRVYMERPWFATGEEEMLGVVLWENSGEDPPESAVPFASDWGEDPIFNSAPLPSRHPSLASFPLATKLESELTLAEIPGLEKFSVAGHKLDLIENYDKERDLWFCDIDVDAGKAYSPFVRLALARYQPNSKVEKAPEVCLSHVVLADFIQLAPNRSASVVYEDGKLYVGVTGESYKSTFGRPAEEKAPAEEGEGPGELQITLEKEEPEIGGELGWEEVETVIASAEIREGIATWTASLDRPEEPSRYRLVLEQFEILPTDGSGHPTEKRIVYTDMIPLGSVPERCKACE